VYVVGVTHSTDWITGGFDTNLSGNVDAFVMKLTSTGGHAWGTYLGGDDGDWGGGIAVDANDSVYVTGSTESDGWVSGGFDTSYYPGLPDAFVAKLAGTGGHVWSTYLGGDGRDCGYGITVDATGNVYVAGETYSDDWVSGGFDTSRDGEYDAFVAKITDAAQSLEQLTIGESYTGNISPGDWQVFFIEVEAGGHLLVKLEPGLPSGRLEFYGRYSVIPTRSTYDYATRTRNASGNYELLISSTESGRYYFAVYARDIDTSMGYKLTASYVSRHVSNVYPRVVVQSENVSIHILGIGFTPGMKVELQTAGGGPIAAKAVVLSAPTMIVAHLNLSGTPLGLYDVAIIWPDGHRVEIPGALEVRELQQGSLSAVPDLKLSEGEKFTLDVDVPETQNLFVTLQKTTLVSYGNSWRGQLSLLRDGAKVASTTGSHDLILHIVNPAPGSYQIDVTAEQAGEGILTAWTALPELPLGQWTVGTIYCSYGSVWYQVDVPPGQDQLLFEAEAMGLWSHFDIYLGQYGSLDHWVSHQGTRISLEIPNPHPGIYIVEFLDSAMISGDSGWAPDQSRDVLLKADTVVSTDPDPDYVPTITSISPDKGGNTGFVTVTIEGGWLDPNATVSLVRGGQPVITAMSVYGEPDQTTLIATFDLDSQQPGQCSLVVTNPDGQTATSPMPFVIEQGGEPELWMEIIGREKVREGRPATYVVRHGNKGNVPSWDCYAIIKFSSGCYFKVDLPGFQEYSEEYLSSEEHTLVVSIPILPSGSSGEFTFWLKTYQTGKVKIQYQIISLSSEYQLPGGEDSFVSSATSEAPEGGYAVYYPPGTEPPVGAVLYWNLGHAAMHTGIYLGNGRTAEVLSPEGQDYGLFDLITGCVQYEIREMETSKRFSESAGYFGAWTWPGYTPEEGQLIADKARAQLGETGTYALIKDNKPFVGKYKNCNSLVYEVLADVFQREHIKWYCNPRTTFMHFITLSPYPEKYAAWPTIILMEFYENHIKMAQDFIGISPMCTPPNGEEKEIEVVFSITPEDKYGPTGYDPADTPAAERKRFVQADREHYFRVDFWNKEDATAPAYDVLVEDQLDSNLDWSSFRFEDTGFLKWNVDLRPCQYFNVDVDTRPDMDWIVNVEGTFDPEKGKVTWWFRTLDPNTHETPDDPEAGFLPPITESGEEIGWVGFTVRPKAGLATGTQIANQAFVEFDHAGDLQDHPAPKEGPWINMLDAEWPTSQVSPLPEFTETRSFLVEWSGQDDLNGSGIQGYDIYVSTDSSDYVLWLANTTDTSGTFVGEGGHTYSFYSRARDNVGHVEPAPASPDTTTINTVHSADTDNDYVIGDFELLDYIDLWKEGLVDDFELLDTIGLWKAGHYYWDESEQKFMPGEQ